MVSTKKVIGGFISLMVSVTLFVVLYQVLIPPIQNLPIDQGHNAAPAIEPKTGLLSTFVHISLAIIAGVLGFLLNHIFLVLITVVIGILLYQYFS